VTERVFLTCTECKERLLVNEGVWTCPDCGGKLEYDIYSKNMYSDCVV